MFNCSIHFASYNPYLPGVLAHHAVSWFFRSEHRHLQFPIHSPASKGLRAGIHLVIKHDRMFPCFLSAQGCLLSSGGSSVPTSCFWIWICAKGRSEITMRDSYHQKLHSSCDYRGQREGFGCKGYSLCYEREVTFDLSVHDVDKTVCLILWLIVAWKYNTSRIEYV